MNLKDRMKSDLQSSNPKENALQSENVQNNSTSMRKKSNQQSRELELLKEQSEALKKLTEERNNLWKDNQKKSEIIISQNKKIEQLQQSEQKTRQEAEARVEAAKNKSKEDSISQRESLVFKSVSDNQREDLEESLGIMKQKLQKKYNAMTEGYKWMVHFTLFYAIIATILMAWKTDVIRTEFIELIHIVLNIIKNVFDWSMTAGLFVSKLGDMIPYSILGTVVHWMLLILVCGGIIGGLGWTIAIMGKRYINFFREKQADEISVFVGLLILAIIVFMADVIKSILLINLFFVAIALFIGYSFVREVIQVENTEVKKKILKYLGIVIGGIGGFVIMVNFFEGITLFAMLIGCLLGCLFIRN